MVSSCTSFLNWVSGVSRPFTRPMGKLPTFRCRSEPPEINDGGEQFVDVHGRLR